MTDLDVRVGSTLVAGSNTPRNLYEKCTFVAKTTGTANITVVDTALSEPKVEFALAAIELELREVTPCFGLGDPASLRRFADMARVVGCTTVTELGATRLNSDAIDNSAGVDSSDREVNIKILLSDVAKSRKMTRKRRDDLLASMTDDVADYVLRNNYMQTQALSMIASSPQSRGYTTRVALAIALGGLLVGSALGPLRVVAGELGTTLRAAAVIVFLLLTAPVGAHLIGRAAYHRGIYLFQAHAQRFNKRLVGKASARLESTAAPDLHIR